MPLSLLNIFGNAGLMYGVLLPLLTLSLFALIAASAMQTGKSIEGVAKSTYCYLAQFLGILLMSLGALPTVYAVLSGNPLSTPTYLALLGVFAGGGLTFLWHDALAQTISASARAVPFALYFYTIKFLGALAFILSALTLLLLPTIAASLPANWWVMPTTILLYGLLLSWFTRTQGEEWSMFTTAPSPSPSRATTRKKSATKRRTKNRK
jgi:hypothetical protein